MNAQDRAVQVAIDAYLKMRDDVGSCTDGGCVIKRPVGMHTNGGCRCTTDYVKMQRMMYVFNNLKDAIMWHPNWRTKNV